MFLPYLLSFQSFWKTPVVYGLFALNLFGVIMLLGDEDFKMKDNFLFKEKNLIQVGEFYANSEYFAAHNQEHSQNLSPKQKVQMGLLAIRNRFVMRDLANEKESLKITDDEVLNAKLKQQLSEFFKAQKERLSFALGLSQNSSIKSYLTYQFTHAGVLHFASNMMFMLAIGGYLEMLLGSFGLLCLYFFGGIVGGLFFNFFNFSSFIPMIGASGSISAMLAFVAFHELHRKAKFVYFLSPLKNHHGIAYLPLWWIIPLYLVADLAYLISAPQGVVTGVAYAAHVGGAAFGMVCALIWRKMATRSRWVQILGEEYFQSQQLAP